VSRGRLNWLLSTASHRARGRVPKPSSGVGAVAVPPAWARGARTPFSGDPPVAPRADGCPRGLATAARSRRLARFATLTCPRGGPCRTLDTGGAEREVAGRPGWPDVMGPCCFVTLRPRRSSRFPGDAGGAAGGGPAAGRRWNRAPASLAEYCPRAPWPPPVGPPPGGRAGGADFDDSPLVRGARGAVQPSVRLRSSTSFCPGTSPPDVVWTGSPETDRSSAQNESRYVEPQLPLQVRAIMFSTCACNEKNVPERGQPDFVGHDHCRSEQQRTGLSPSRWRWPPENACG